MATATITPEQNIILVEIQIAAPPARVFQAITDPRQMLHRWGQAEMYRTTKFETDVRVHGKWASTGVSADGSTFRSAVNILKSILLACLSIRGWQAGRALSPPSCAGNSNLLPKARA
jgi:hypothetical protein